MRTLSFQLESSWNDAPLTLRRSVSTQTTLLISILLCTQVLYGFNMTFP